MKMLQNWNVEGPLMLPLSPWPATLFPDTVRNTGIPHVCLKMRKNYIWLRSRLRAIVRFLYVHLQVLWPHCSSKWKTHSRTCDNIMFFHPITCLKCFNENDTPLGPKTAKKASHETFVKNFFMIFSALKFLNVVWRESFAKAPEVHFTVLRFKVEIYS